MKKILISTMLLGICSFPILAQSTIDTCSKYLTLYTSMKFDELGEYYTDQSIFEDPTMSFFDQTENYVKKTGKEQIVTFLKEGFSKISNIEFDIEKQYSVGVISYYYGILNYDYVINHEGLEKLLKIKLPLAIILEVKDGKVIHHQDIANYYEWHQQYKNQLGQG
ncbi:nuclear transport factor 2 family protein [Fulvivirga sp.]|uniref:nuclear transport factor 2 family protein n=1 Tax=Fulvivirga sp. TaxID=1931237 RepID=UPI0032F09CC7